MPDRKSLIEKSKPFTTCNLKIPHRVAICGNIAFKEKWDKVFSTKIDKSDFFLQNIRKDLGVNDLNDVDEDVNKNCQKTINFLIDAINLKFQQEKNSKYYFSTLQQYIEFCLDRKLIKDAKK